MNQELPLRYDGSLEVDEARRRYYEANGFPPDGGDSESWVKVKVGFIPFWFPNSDARRRAVRLHDLHHVATEYDTDMIGEAEIGAWEVGAGCGRYWAAWMLNLMAMSYGLVFAPRRVSRAFRRGRKSTSLYHRGFGPDLLEVTVADLRRQLGL